MMDRLACLQKLRTSIAGEAQIPGAGICGFFGASSVERLPTDRTVTEQAKSFKDLNLHPGPSERSRYA
jgi:hypothetical protein